MRTESSFPGKAGIFILSMALGLAVGFFDVLLDYLFFYSQKSFLELAITDVPPHEAYIRLIILLLFLGFGTFAQRQLRQEDKIRQDLEKILKERDFLFRELNHRVKNNLQVISGLIDLKKSQAMEPETQRALTEIWSRCESIAMIHKLLYGEGVPDSIRLDLYIKDFTSLLGDLLREDKHIGIDVEADEVSVGIDVAVPCGLMVNELIVNAFKHAFPERDTGMISVRLHRRPGNGFILIVGDNGVGMREDADPASGDSLGLTLVHGLARQIDAELEVRGNPGTSVVLTYHGNKR